MNKTILFSPVGGTDPISLNNCYDGSMLHIFRYYKPDKVYLYMSKEILENHDNPDDNRYIYCLDKLSELLNHKYEYEVIRRDELNDVQEYNYFYEDFRKIISTIVSTMDETDKLILNVSSGTPAMKSALIVLNVIGELPFELIQVLTPTKKMGEHEHKNYDVVTLWELNEDNLKEENRCIKVECPNLTYIQAMQMIKKQISKYEYKSALEIAEMLPESVSIPFIEQIRFAHYRLMLDFQRADSLIKTTGYKWKLGGEKREVFEYILNMEIKYKKGEYADFVRAISPIIVELMVRVTNKIFGIDIYKNYCRLDNGMYIWDKGKLDKDENGRQIINILESTYNVFNYDGFVKADHLKAIIVNISSDKKMSDEIRKLRIVESNVRNKAAHQLVSVTDEKIESWTNDISRTERKELGGIWKGMGAKEIIACLKNVCKYTDLNIKTEWWNDYDEMNQWIIERIN